MVEFYDTHAHLDEPDFQADLPEVLRRAEEAGVARIMAVGTDLESSRRVVALAERYGPVFAVVGWHPSHAGGAPADIRPELRRWAGHPKVVALGETGLDYHRLPSGRGGSPADDASCKLRQAEIFRQHLEVAAETGLNCVIHQRSALDDTLGQFSPYADRVRGQFHCFAEAPEVLRRIVQLGSLVSFTGILTFKNGGNIREALGAAALGEFLLETDCPYLAPAPFRGQRCEPAYVKEIANVAADVKGCSLEELSRATCAATRTFFPKLG